MPIIPKDIGCEILHQKLSLNFLDQGKGKGKETSNTTDLEHLHLDGSDEEIGTQTLYEKKVMEIFATPHNSKLAWLTARLQKKKGPSMLMIRYSVAVGLRRYFSEITLRR